MANGIVELSEARWVWLSLDSQDLEWQSRGLEQQVSVAIVLLQGGMIDGEQTRYCLTCKTNQMKNKTGAQATIMEKHGPSPCFHT